MPTERRLEDRTAIVTGSSSGLGRSIARLFSEHGAKVILADIREDPVEGGEPTASLITSSGGRCRYVHTDLGSPHDIERLVTGTLEDGERLDVVVNNAATYVSKPLLTTTKEEWERVFAVNVTGPFLLSQAAVGRMVSQEPDVNGVRGRLVNITSQHGMIAAPDDIAYGTSKSALVYMTRQIASDYAEQGIVCNAVAPGKIVTGKGGAEDAISDYAKARTPWPRLGEPDDVSRAALFLASDEATYITGVNLMVDGGWMAS